MPTRARRLSLSLLTVFAIACAGHQSGKAATSKGAFLSGIAAASKSNPPMLVLGTAASGTLAATDPMLADSSHYDQWAYAGRSGEKIKITMESSAFDAFLILVRQNGGRNELLEEDNDSAGGTNAQIRFTLPSDGVYSVLALSFDNFGPYTLRVERDGAPNGVQ